MTKSAKSANDFQSTEFVEVVRTFNAGDIALIVSVFDAYEIEYYVMGENLSFVEAFAEPSRFFVRMEDAQAAIDLLETLSLTYSGLSGPRNSSAEE